CARCIAASWRSSNLSSTCKAIARRIIRARGFRIIRERQMEEIIKLRFKYTEEEYASATRLYMLRSSDLLFRIIASSLLLAGGVFLILLLNIDEQTSIFFILVGVIWLLFIFLIFFAVPSQRFRSDPKFRD